MQFSVKSFFSSVNAETRDTDKLWQSLKQDDELSFFSLYKRHVRSLFNYGMNACNDRALVMNCLQKLFTLARDQREVLGTDLSVKANLFKSFRQLLIQKISERRGLTAMPDTFQSLFEFTPRAENLGTGRNGYGMKAKKTVQFNHRQQEAVFLKFYAEFSYAEIAVIMELNVEFVHDLVVKAVENSHRRMKDVVPT